MNPLSVLITGLLFLIVIFILLRPENGLWARIRNRGRQKQRILLEDTLKHLYDHEYHHRAATLSSISGALGLSRDKTTQMLKRLIELKLATYKDGQWLLTPEGRGYAIRILRIHRLWERYLADETGVSETDWHRQAEIREHHISSEEAERLYEAMGRPVYDPHGDPIPNRLGELPPQTGQPLTRIEPGHRARIIHLEDEPVVLFEQLTAEGLYPGMHIRVERNDEDKVVIRGDGREIPLAPVVAANITVVPVEAPPNVEESPTTGRTLAQTHPGETVVVTALSPALRGLQRRRLMDLGIVPGTRITRELVSMGGDPVAYNIRGALIALRNDQARYINVKQTMEENEHVM